VNHILSLASTIAHHASSWRSARADTRCCKT